MTDTSEEIHLPDSGNSKPLAVAGTTPAEAAPPAAEGTMPAADAVPPAEGTACEPAAAASSEDGQSDAAAGEATLSKRQRKRLARREAFLAQRPALRRAERQRRKEKRAAAVAAALAAGAAPPKRPRLAPMASGSDVRVVIDLSFDELMTERDLAKCLKQVQRCYAANRRAARPVQLVLTSMDGESRRLMDANDGWQNWDVRVESGHLLDALPADTVTYLTSDSENQLDALLPGRAYVIGGLVDHNHHKGECLRRAREAGLAHARLPIDDFVEMKTRKVLTIDHVFSILLLVAGGSGWQRALQQVLPARKGAVLRETDADGPASGPGAETDADGPASGPGAETDTTSGPGAAERTTEHGRPESRESSDSADGHVLTGNTDAAAATDGDSGPAADGGVTSCPMTVENGAAAS